MARAGGRGPLGVLASLLPLAIAGCFEKFEAYRQLEAPTRPPGAVSLPGGPAHEVFPLQPGARFEYTAHFGLGAAGPFSGRAAASVVDAWLLGDRESAELRVSSTYFGRTREDPYTFARSHAWIGLFEKFPPDKLTNFLPTRLAAGQAWDVVTGEGTGHARVEAVEPVRVPAGRYPAAWRVRYRNPQARTDITLWLVPRLGLVRSDVAMTAGLLPLRGRLELEHYAPPLERDEPMRPSASPLLPTPAPSHAPGR